MGVARGAAAAQAARSQKKAPASDAHQNTPETMAAALMAKKHVMGQAKVEYDPSEEEMPPDDQCRLSGELGRQVFIKVFLSCVLQILEHLLESIASYRTKAGRLARCRSWRTKQENDLKLLDFCARWSPKSGFRIRSVLSS